jgi:hypothetical protein
MSISVLNTDAGLSGTTLLNAESTQTITGSKTFDRDPSAPFTVTSGSAVVTNLDADKLDGVEGAGYADIAQTRTISGVWTFSAKPAFNAAIQFPATQAASADANALDDYEEGSWSPTIVGTGGQSGQAYSTQQGQYVKIGKQVFVSGRVVLSTLGTVTTAAAIGNLPFTADSVAYSTGPVYWFALTNPQVSMLGLIPAGGTRIELFTRASAGTGMTALLQADMSNTSDFIFSAVYRASA